MTRDEVRDELDNMFKSLTKIRSHIYTESGSWHRCPYVAYSYAQTSRKAEEVRSLLNELSCDLVQFDRNVEQSPKK